MVKRSVPTRPDPTIPAHPLIENIKACIALHASAVASCGLKACQPFQADVAHTIVGLIADHIRQAVPLTECMESSCDGQQIYFDQATVAELEKYRETGLHPLLETAIADQLQGAAVRS